MIEPGLRRQSRHKGNIRGRTRRLSPIGPEITDLGIWRRNRTCEKRHADPSSRLPGKLTERRNAWLGREGSNLRMAESKSAALPLGYAPTGLSASAGP